MIEHIGIYDQVKIKKLPLSHANFEYCVRNRLVGRMPKSPTPGNIVVPDSYTLLLTKTSKYNFLTINGTQVPFFTLSTLVTAKILNKG